MNGDDPGAPDPGVAGRHPDFSPELRQLAQAILDRLDPAVRMAAARAAATGSGPGQCQQVWCPVCALAALVTGEQHPLLTVIAEHSIALLTVVRAMVGDPAAESPQSPQPPQPPSDPAGPSGADEPAPSAPGNYEHIPVSFEE